MMNPIDDCSDDNKLVEIKKLFYEWIDKTTVHGLPNSAKEKRKALRIFWFLSFFASILFCIFLVTKNFESYFNYEKVSQVEMINEVPSVFPAISICNLNTFATEYSWSFINQTMSTYNLTHFLKKKSGEKFTKADIADMMSLIKGQALGLTSVKDKYNKQMLSLTIETMILECSFNGKKCSHLDFDWFYDIKYGNCYTFNSGRFNRNVLTSAMAGSVNGLAVSLYLGNPASFLSLQEYAGVRLVVHQQNIIPTSSEGIFV